MIRAGLLNYGCDIRSLVPVATWSLKLCKTTLLSTYAQPNVKNLPFTISYKHCHAHSFNSLVWSAGSFSHAQLSSHLIFVHYWFTRGRKSLWTRLHNHVQQNQSLGIVECCCTFLCQMWIRHWRKLAMHRARLIKLSLGGCTVVTSQQQKFVCWLIA